VLSLVTPTLERVSLSNLESRLKRWILWKTKTNSNTAENHRRIENKYIISYVLCMLTVLLSEQKVKILYKQILYRQIYHLSSILFKYGVQPHYT